MPQRRDDLGQNPVPDHLQHRRAADSDLSAIVTKEDLWRLGDTITAVMNKGFDGVHRRQDTTNGRVNSAHEMLAVHKTKITNLDREVFDRPRAAQATAGRDVGPSPDQATSDRRITERDVKMFLAGGSALSATVLFFWKVLPFMFQALRAHP